MKTYYSVCFLILLAQFSFSSPSFCPDPPINDDPCMESDNPPFDLTDVNVHAGTTCCARGPQDENPDGSVGDFENVDCSDATQDAAVWYVYYPSPEDDGYQIVLQSGGVDPSEGPLAIEVYSGFPDQGCNVGFGQTIASSCASTNAILNIGNCIDTDKIIFIKVSSDDALENCGSFNLSINPADCGSMADACSDLDDSNLIQPITNEIFSIDYTCVSGCLDFACPEESANGGCLEFLEMPTVWFKVYVDNIATQMFTTVSANGNWEPIWSIYSGSDCDNLTALNLGESPSCSNGDNTPELHQSTLSMYDQFYWVSVTADPASLPASGLDDGSFELCVATTIDAFVCLGGFEGGDCGHESLVIEITERDNDGLSLDGPFCQGEEVTVYVSLFYDASESGNDWLIGIVPSFGQGWDMEGFNFEANAPFANGLTATWHEEGKELAPILQEQVPTLCTYRDEAGVLQLCNQLCEPCMECDQQGMEEGDPLPSGYFWITNAGGPGCENDGSPGEGWGIGSTTAQIDWQFTLRVKEYDNFDGCFDKNDLSISFQTFSDGIAGCWDDVNECVMDRAMFGPAWTIGCSEIPPGVIANNIEICTKQVADVAINSEDGSSVTIVVTALDNPNVTGANDYVFENGVGVITDFLVNQGDKDEIVQYEIYTIDPEFECYGAKRIVEVLVRSQFIEQLEEVVCICLDGCSTIGFEQLSFSSYLWSTGEQSNIIEVCPEVPTTYSVTVTDELGCEHFGTILVDCEGETEECNEIVDYKLIYDFFIDDNANGIRDSLENSFADGAFYLEPNQTTIYNTSLGEDTLFLEAGMYALTYLPTTLADWSLTTDSIVYVDLFPNQDCAKVEFGLKENDLIRNVELEYFLNRRCNTDQDFLVIANNLGTKTERGTLWAELDEDILPDDISSTTRIDTFIAPNRVGWFFEDLLPGSTIVKLVNVHIPGPPDFPVGWVLNHSIYAELSNTDGTTEIWDEKEISGNIQCGYDPNDKAVEPNHEEGYTHIDQEDLIFKVRFQNTGNAPAENIEIRDTLSEFLDISTIQYIEGSHDEYLTFSRINDRVLIFNFDNINLPDSTADIKGSQGFLLYKVSLNDELPEGTLIENTAHIYFDNNPAVVTNTTKNILYPDLDEDGFYSIEDCDEGDADINPNAQEIPNNEVDEDCDGVALIIDNDMDGFNSDEDCDDENPDINPDAEEIINNTIDENCDNLVVIIDADMDGFNSDDDCNDDDADINPDAEEVANNDIDEDCDGVAVIIDEDMDGFNSDDDCNDDDADINPDAEEIANNDIDEDCDGVAVIIDEDMDGFNSDDDCDDADADINPDAEDIPGNGIDEDCDGEDAVIIGVEEQLWPDISINPNPSNDVFNITINTSNEVNYIVRDVIGREVKRGKISLFNNSVYLGSEPNGLYLLVLSNPKIKQYSFHKLLKI